MSPFLYFICIFIILIFCAESLRFWVINLKKNGKHGDKWQSGKVTKWQVDRFKITDRKKIWKQFIDLRVQISNKLQSFVTNSNGISIITRQQYIEYKIIEMFEFFSINAIISNLLMINVKRHKMYRMELFRQIYQCLEINLNFLMNVHITDNNQQSEINSIWLGHQFFLFYEIWCRNDGRICFFSHKRLLINVRQWLNNIFLILL